MYKIDGNTIKVNRGDKFSFNFYIPLTEEKNYVFKEGDKLKFGVYGKKEYEVEALLLKEFIVEEETEKVKMEFSSEETKIGELIEKPTNYWYEIQLNDEQTVLGYDEEGAKILMLFPEGSDII